MCRVEIILDPNVPMVSCVPKDKYSRSLFRRLENVSSVVVNNVKLLGKISYYCLRAELGGLKVTGESLVLVFLHGCCEHNVVTCYMNLD